MASITTYSTLVQALIDEAEDDGTEFAAFIPTAIDLTEEKLFKELELPELEEKETGTLTGAIATLSKPTNYKFADYFMITDGSGNNIVLKKKLESFLRDYWSSGTDIPKYYSDETSTTFRLAPTPSSNFAYEIKYTKEPTKLSTGNETNYYTDNCQDALFHGSMLEMAKFMKAWDQIPVWEQSFNQVRDTWNIQMMRYRRDGGMKTQSINNTGPNSLKHTVNTNA